jgi:hypothetical protein
MSRRRPRTNASPIAFARSKCVIVAGDKVFQIANQNAAGLANLAGSKVKIGETGDAVTISKIEKAQ